MTSPAITVFPETPIAAAARLLHHHHLKRLPVVDDGRHLVGIVSRADLVKLFIRPDEEIRDEVAHHVIGEVFCIDRSTVKVEVHEGVVRLEGEVEHKELIPLLVDLVRAVDGVVDVEEQLSFQHDYRRQKPSGWVRLGMFPKTP